MPRGGNGKKIMLVCISFRNRMRMETYLQRRMALSSIIDRLKMKQKIIYSFPSFWLYILCKYFTYKLDFCMDKRWMDGWSCVIIEIDKFTSLLWVSWVVVLAGFGVLDLTSFWFFFTLFLAPHPSTTYSCFPFSSPLLSLHSSSCPSIHLYTCRNNLPASRWRCLDGQQLSISSHA